MLRMPFCSMSQLFGPSMYSHIIRLILALRKCRKERNFNIGIYKCFPWSRNYFALLFNSKKRKIKSPELPSIASISRKSSNLLKVSNTQDVWNSSTPRLAASSANCSLFCSPHRRSLHTRIPRSSPNDLITTQMTDLCAALKATSSSVANTQNCKAGINNTEILALPLKIDHDGCENDTIDCAKYLSNYP